MHAMLSKLAQFTDIRLALVVGGLSLQAQASTLRTNPEVVVATPVRFIYRRLSKCYKHEASETGTLIVINVQLVVLSIKVASIASSLRVDY